MDCIILLQVNEDTHETGDESAELNTRPLSVVDLSEEELVFESGLFVI